MWTWTLNWGEIRRRILIGTCPMTPADLDRIAAATGVSAVLSLQHAACLDYWRIDHHRLRDHGKSLGLHMLRSPMRDFDIADQRRRLPAAVAALAGLQAQGHRTYVHCTAGLGRAPLTVLSYLVWIEGWSPEEAIGLIHAARPGAVPAWEAHHGCREDLVERYRSRIEERAYALSQARDLGQGDAETDWIQAEREVLRMALLGG
jgi:atypical dual specificity phosphatase